MRSWPISAPPFLRRWLVAFGVMVCVAALAAAAAVSAAETPLPLKARVFNPSELHSLFLRPGKEGTTRDPATWSRDSGLTVAQLRRDGFVVGIREDSKPRSPVDAVGVSLAAQFKTPAGAARAVAQEPTHPRKFPVPGIPGARGYKYLGQTREFDIYFADGDFEYAEVVAQPGDEGGLTGLLLAAATRSLYHRVHGRPAP